MFLVIQNMKNAFLPLLGVNLLYFPEMILGDIKFSVLNLISNRLIKNQSLKIDSSNEVVIGYSSTIFPLNYSINFNESGEEIYICENGTLKIYVYKSYLETLLLLSAAVVSRTYSLS